MATARRNKNGGITLKVSQDEADLIRSIFGDLFSTNAPGANRERDMVTDIYDALDDLTESRSYRLHLAQGGGRRRPFGDNS